MLLAAGVLARHDPRIGHVGRRPRSRGCDGAVTKPWEPNVTFRALAPDEFAEFREPGYVKIAWTIRADDITAAESVIGTETGAIATDVTLGSKSAVTGPSFRGNTIAVRLRYFF